MTGRAVHRFERQTVIDAIPEVVHHILMRLVRYPARAIVKVASW
jgi:hypothetical protein